MEENQNVRHGIFCGTYEINLGNGCLILPEPFLEKLEAESPEKKVFCFVTWDVLQLYSEQGLYDFAKKIKMSHYDQMSALRFMATWLPDGEITIPAWLMEKYGFLRYEKIAVVGKKDHIELWKMDALKQQEEALDKEMESNRYKIFRELGKSGI